MPYDAVGSSVRLNVDPKDRGAIKITLGGEGFCGLKVVTTLLGAKGFDLHTAAVPVQRAFTRPPIRVTVSPRLRYVMLLATMVAAPKDALTVWESDQVHVVNDALLKANSELQSQVTSLMLPKSVGESKLIRADWPLSVNLQDVITGGGVTMTEDVIRTEDAALTNCSLLDPVMPRDKE